MENSLERRTYDNGLVAIAEPIEGKKKAFLLVGMDVGAKNESSEKKGGAHLLEHMMFNSNEYRTREEIAEVSEFNGIETNAGTSITNTILEFNLPPDQLPISMELAYQSIISRGYREEEFLNERDGPVTAELVMHERSPHSRFSERRLRPVLYKGSVWDESAIGTLQSLKSLQLSDLIDLKERFYVPNNIIIVSTGDVDKAKFFDEVENKFGKMRYKEVKQPDLSWKLNPMIFYDEISEFKDSIDSDKDQALISMIHKVSPISQKDYLGLEIIDYIIGGGFTSYLMQELRQKRGIGYTPSSSLNSTRGNGTFSMSVPGLKPCQIKETVNVMREIIKNLSNDIVSERFFEGKKTQYFSAYLGNIDSASRRAIVRLDEYFEKPFYDILEIPARLNDLTSEGIREIAQRNFSGEPFIAIGNPPGYSNLFI